ncbi:uncharacterized protein PAF06_013926 [Gastrophryne carolinensis]
MGTNLAPSMGYYLPPRYCLSPAPPPTLPQVTTQLENKELWEKFNSVGTEMILTKNGRRMFPELSVSLSGLDPHCVYSLCVQAVPEGENRYKWRDGVWSMSGRAEPGPPTRLYLHPESPAPGHRWMERPVCFNKIRLTNNTLSQGGQIVLQSMHRYSLRLYIIPASSGGSSPRHVTTVSFPETSFIAVTSYQNPKLSLLKIEENPFAKGIKYFKNQQESHTPRKKSVRPEEFEDGGLDCKRIKESRGPPKTPIRAHCADSPQLIQEESTEESGEKPESPKESAEERAENCPQGGEVSRAEQLEAEKHSEYGRGSSPNVEKREERALRTDTIVQWGPLPHRTTWLPPTAVSPLAVTPYTPTSCFMAHRFSQPVPSSLTLFPSPITALSPVTPPAPYYLGPWSPQSVRLNQPHPGLPPQFLQQMCVPPWFLSPNCTSRGL